MPDQEMYSIISEIDPSNTGSIQYAAFKQKVVLREVEKRVEGDVSELLDAYVAMGGEADGGGCVDGSATTRGGDVDGNGLPVCGAIGGAGDGDGGIFCGVEDAVATVVDGNRDGGRRGIDNDRLRCSGT